MQKLVFASLSPAVAEMEEGGFESLVGMSLDAVVDETELGCYSACGVADDEVKATEDAVYGEFEEFDLDACWPVKATFVVFEVDDNCIVTRFVGKRTEVLSVSHTLTVSWGKGKAQGSITCEL